MGIWTLKDEASAVEDEIFVDIKKADMELRGDENIRESCRCECWGNRHKSECQW